VPSGWKTSSEMHLKSLKNSTEQSTGQATQESHQAKGQNAKWPTAIENNVNNICG